MEKQRTKGEGVVLSTLHSSKGLEYDVVFLIDVNEKIMPVERGNKRVTNSIISTGGTAGGQSDADGRRGIAAVVAGVALAVIGLLVAAGDQSKDHREGENKS